MKSLPARDRWAFIIIPFIFAALLGIYPLPRAGQALVSAAMLASQWGNHHSAALAFEQAAKLLPAHPELWEQAARAAYEAQEFETAVRLFEKSKISGTLSEDSMWLLADSYQAADQSKDALQIWEDLSAANPSDPIALERLVDSYLADQDIDRAASAAHRLSNLQPDNGEAAFRLGLLLAVTAPETAHTVFLRAGELNPDNLSKITRVENGIASAGLEADPAYGLTVTAQALAAIGEWRIAEIALQRALAARPDYAEAWALLSEARQQSGADGGEEIAKALSINPDSVLALSLAAVRSQRRQEWESAIGYLQKVSSLDSDNAHWLVELGISYAGSGNLALAYDHFLKAVDLDPDNPIIWRELAAFSFSSNYLVNDSGFPAARRAVQLAPEDPASLDILGQAYMIQGDLVNAEKFFTRAVVASPDFGMAYLHLGKVKAQQGFLDQARQAFQKAIVIDPVSQAGRQAQRLIEELGLVR